MDKKKALKGLGIIILLQFAFIALFVWFFDPFYQYHEPYLGINKVLYDRDNQVPGTIRSFAYDSVLLGSSVAENFDSAFLDKAYDCDTLKIIKAAGSTADLLYYLEQAHQQQKLQNVFWTLDIFALTSSGEVSLYGDEIPRYLHTESVLDDIPYVYNKEIIFEKIPLMLAYSFMDMNTGGHAYDWSKDKTFCAAKAMEAYIKPDSVILSRDYSVEKENIENNVNEILAEIRLHPEVNYIVIMPPYSMLWWDCGYVNGEGEMYFYVLEKILSALLTCNNASVYFFQAEKEIICNLDNYMDMIHYSPQINQFMLEAVVNDSYRVTWENKDDILDEMHQVYEYIITEGIYQYYPKQ